MDEIRVRLIVAIIGAIVTGTLSGVGTYFSQENVYATKIEELSKESQRKENRIINLSDENKQINSDLELSQSEHNNLIETYNNLIEEYKELQDRYELCISTDGFVTIIGSIDINSYEELFNTGDQLRFKLTSSSIFIDIIRVSKEGPIISINGCKNYVTENEILMNEYDKTKYVLKLNKPLIIRFTSQSCEDNENINPTYMEEIVLTLLEFNVDNQNINLRYQRKFL